MSNSALFPMMFIMPAAIIGLAIVLYVFYDRVTSAGAALFAGKASKSVESEGQER